MTRIAGHAMHVLCIYCGECASFPSLTVLLMFSGCAAISSRVTASHPNSAVKLDRARVVLRWGTTREGRVLHIFLFSLHVIWLYFLFVYFLFVLFVCLLFVCLLPSFPVPSRPSSVFGSPVLLGHLDGSAPIHFATALTCTSSTADRRASTPARSLCSP